MSFFLSLFSIPIAFAATEKLDQFIKNVDDMIINPIILFLFALAVVYFLYGVFQFLVNQASEEKKTSGKSHMLWGIVGITIMLGVWTMMNIILNTLSIPSDQINPETGDVKLPDYVPPPAK